jgi:hypothetical protein
VGVGDDDGDAGVAHLEHDVPGAQGGVGEDDGRVEREDRLGVEVVAVLRDQRQVGGLGELGGGVAPDDLAAQAELVDGAREGAVEVEGQDAAGVGDRDLGPLRVLDRDRQLRLGTGHRVDGCRGRDGARRALPGARIGQHVVAHVGERGRHRRGGGRGRGAVRAGRAARENGGEQEGAHGGQGRGQGGTHGYRLSIRARPGHAKLGEANII